MEDSFILKRPSACRGGVVNGKIHDSAKPCRVDVGAVSSYFIALS
jgi:hypothetical protein